MARSKKRGSPGMERILTNMHINMARSKKRGSPGMERILTNMHINMAQYLHILLAMMMLRAFLFRSFFACLPWLVGYQCLPLKLPLENMDVMGQQVPLEKCPLK